VSGNGCKRTGRCKSGLPKVWGGSFVVPLSSCHLRQSIASSFEGALRFHNGRPGRRASRMMRMATRAEAGVRAFVSLVKSEHQDYIFIFMLTCFITCTTDCSLIGTRMTCFGKSRMFEV
jgi:hypothetical protein